MSPLRFCGPAVCALLCVLAQRPASADDGLFDRLDANGDGQVAAGEVEDKNQRLFQRLLRKADGNRDGRLSREEMAAGLAPEKPAASAPSPEGDRPRFDPQQIFRRLDRDGDAKISRDEAPERLRGAFDRVDANGDGTIDRGEFTRAMAAASSDRPGGRMKERPDAARTNQIVEQVFSRRDANGDGKISLDEVPEERRDGFRRLLERFDDDGDKALTKEQFAKALGALRGASDRQNGGRPQDRTGAQAIVQRLKQADTDGDGKISRDEAPERLRRLFDRIDANSDGHLDGTEIRRMLARRQMGDARQSDQKPSDRDTPRPKRPAGDE